VLNNVYTTQFKGYGNLTLLLNRGINDIGGKVSAGIVDTGGKFNADVIATGVSKINVDLGKDMTAVINDTGGNFNACFKNTVVQFAGGVNDAVVHFD
jgi:hypothetical protein